MDGCEGVGAQEKDRDDFVSDDDPLVTVVPLHEPPQVRLRHKALFQVLVSIR